MRFKNSKFISVAVAVLTLFGLAIHDTKVDTMTAFAVALPVAVAAYEGAGIMLQLGGDAHTHVETFSVRQVVQKSTSLNPLLPPRPNENKGYRLQKGVPKGHHPFDNYNLPVIA